MKVGFASAQGAGKALGRRGGTEEGEEEGGKREERGGRGGIKKKGYRGYPFGGEMWVSNPRPTEPQSDALTS